MQPANSTQFAAQKVAYLFHPSHRWPQLPQCSLHAREWRASSQLDRLQVYDTSMQHSPRKINGSRAQDTASVYLLL